MQISPTRQGWNPSTADDMEYLFFTLASWRLCMKFDQHPVPEKPYFQNQPKEQALPKIPLSPGKVAAW